MSRKLYEKFRGNYVGVFPPEGGWQAGRKGIRRKLCPIEKLEHLSELERTMRLTELYSRKAREISDEKYQKEQERKKKAQRKLWTVKQASDAWLTSVAARCSKKTVDSYKPTIKYYLEACGNHPMLEYDSQKYELFLKYLNIEANYRGKKLADTSKHTHVRQLKNFLLFCVDKRIIDHMERLKMPRLPSKDMHTLELIEIGRLRKYLNDQRIFYLETGDEKKALDMKNMHRAFMMATQLILRLGAIWSLRLDCISMENRIVHIRDNKELGWKNKGLKWPDKPVNEKMYEFLVQDFSERNPEEKYYLDDGHGNQWNHNQGCISTLGTEIFKALNFPKGMKPFHWGMRATMITELLLAGEDPYSVQQLADHSNIRTTMLYLNKRKVHQKKASDRIGSLLD